MPRQNQTVLFMKFQAGRSDQFDKKTITIQDHRLLEEAAVCARVCVCVYGAYSRGRLLTSDEKTLGAYVKS